MQESSRDLAALVVPQAGRVVAIDDPWEPYRLVDADGVVVEAVAAETGKNRGCDVKSHVVSDDVEEVD